VLQKKACAISLQAEPLCRSLYFYWLVLIKFFGSITSWSHKIYRNHLQTTSQSISGAKWSVSEAGQSASWLDSRSLQLDSWHLGTNSQSLTVGPSARHSICKADSGQSESVSVTEWLVSGARWSVFGEGWSVSQPDSRSQ